MEDKEVYDENYSTDLLASLSKLGRSTIVLTGVGYSAVKG